MKKYSLETLFFALTFAATGCSSSDLLDDTAVANGSKVLVTAEATSQGGADSRVTFGENGLALLWSADDEIGITAGGATSGTMSLKSGANNNSATFEGKLEPHDGTMCAFYPKDANSKKTYLTTQTGTQADAAKKLVLFGSVDSWSRTPQFTMTAKVSVLKLNMPLPEGVTDVTSVTKVVISGAYSKDTLGTNGEWTNPTVADISLSGAKVVGDKIVGYAVVIPGTLVKDLFIRVSTDKGDYYTEAYTSESATIANNKVIEINKALVAANFKTEYTAANYFRWDAVDSYNGTDGAANTATGSATHSCKDAPTDAEMVKYLHADNDNVYWDGGFGDESNGKKEFTVNGEKHSEGIWLLKKAYWPETITGNAETVSTTPINEANVSIRTDGKHFFLPAAGYYYYGFVGAGYYGDYWSSSPNADGSEHAYLLLFGEHYAGVRIDYRYYGCLPMVAE